MRRQGEPFRPFLPELLPGRLTHAYERSIALQADAGIERVAPGERRLREHMRTLKAAFDPHALLNPGKVL